MGYYTGFSVTVYAGNDKRYDEVIAAAENSGNDELKELITTGFVEAKWYEFDKEFPEFAKQFPDVLFIIDGDGEDQDDIWQQRFKGNLTEFHQVVMPPFTTPQLLTESEKIKDIMKNA